MLIITQLPVPGYEWVVMGKDAKSGLKAIIAVHDTTLGPSLGGSRMWNYAGEEDALKDVLRLSRGMTYKAAITGLPLGGGKSVIIGDPRKDKTEELLLSFGRFVHSLGGMYITAEDVGTCQDNMDVIRRETPHVVGLSSGGGDPAPYTALGVFHGIRAAAEFAWGSENLQDRMVAVQGVGQVGYHLCKLLKKSGARLIVCDVDSDNLERAVAEFGALAVRPEDIYHQEADIFAPCAMGAVINDRTVSSLRCRIVAGSANNVLESDQHGHALHQRGVLYVPDYVINAGGLISVADERNGHNHDRVVKNVEGIYSTVKEILTRVKKNGQPPFLATEELVEARLLKAKQKKALEG